MREIEAAPEWRTPNKEAQPRETFGTFIFHGVTKIQKACALLKGMKYFGDKLSGNIEGSRLINVTLIE